MEKKGAGIKQTMLKVVNKLKHPARLREIFDLVVADMPDVDVLNKSIRAMLTMAAKSGVIGRERDTDGFFVYFRLASSTKSVSAGKRAA